MDTSALLRPRTPAEFNLGLHSRHSSVRSIRLEDDESPPSEPLLDEVKKPVYLTERLLDDNEKPTYTAEVRRKQSNVVFVCLWLLSVALTSACTYFLTRSFGKHGSGSFEGGFQTELDGARSAIRLQTTQFHGSPDFVNRHFTIPIDSPSLEYIGSSPEIDTAWDALTADRYFLLSDDEARAAYGPNPAQYWNVHHGGYIAGLDVLHTLHCLDALRKGLYPDVYPEDPQHGRMHKIHCVDHLRQLVMCHSDLTPVPTQWFESIKRNYINSSREHTCRDFSAVREWATARFNGSTAVKPRNRDGSPRAEFYAPWSP